MLVKKWKLGGRITTENGATFVSLPRVIAGQADALGRKRYDLDVISCQRNGILWPL
jgi:hypothetical protein